jgi:hypothetical protein
MIFITLIPLFVEALGRATEGCPYLPPAVERFPPLHISSFAEHDFARHNILNERLTGISTKSLDQVALPVLSDGIG